mgnify:CR=1 FL=1
MLYSDYSERVGVGRRKTGEKGEFGGERSRCRWCQLDGGHTAGAGAGEVGRRPVAITWRLRGNGSHGVS